MHYYIFRGLLKEKLYLRLNNLDNMKFINYNHLAEGIWVFIRLHVIAWDKRSKCNSLAEP